MVNIIVIGTTGVDYIAVVEKFPSADEKVRSLLSFQCGGGNAGNTSVAISRLGGCCKILSKIGNDSYGEMILKEFRDELIDVDCCIMSTSTLSAFTYVVVDSSSGTRTCIHTPMTEELTPKEINIFVSRSDLSAPLVHFDSRHTLAAVEFASKLSERSEDNRAILSIDLERIRPHIFDLIPYMDIVFSNLKCVDEFCPPK
jgi:sugar/nucleoside kinase (ribokinase family)